MKRLISAIAMALAALPAPAQRIPIPDPLGAMIADGRAAVTSTRWDIGGPEAAFDGKMETPLRTPAVNPAFLQIEFREPYPASAFHLRVAEFSEFRISCADSVRDIQHRDRSYRDLTGLQRTDRRGTATVRLKRPVRARVYRLDTRRLIGDAYVHIFEWQFARLVPAQELRVEPIPARPEWKPGRIIPSGGVVRLKAVASAEGVELEVTDRARFSAPGFRPYRERNALQAPRVQPGESRSVEVTARFSGLSAALPLEIQGWARKEKAPDLDVLFIERTPRIDYDAPDRGNGAGWPAEGAPVRWTARVRSVGAAARNVPYEWRIDGEPVTRGRIRRIAAEGEAAVSLPWNWTQKRRALEFRLMLDPYLHPDQCAANNSRSIATDALTVAFWVEEKLADHWRDNQRDQNPRNNSFEDWAQWMIAEWNRLMEEARYPLSPNGLSDRWRLDRVTVVPGGALPLAGGLPSNNPDNRDRTADIVWGFGLEPDAKVSDYWKLSPEFDPARSTPAFHTDWALLHELSHARYLVDSYGFDVHPDSVRILSPDGRPAVETAEMKALLPYFNKYKGLLGGGIRPLYDEYTAGALERVKGKRARGGNTNSPSVIGEYLNDLPARNIFQFLDHDGRPLAGAKVSLWRAKPVRTAWYGKRYEGEPDQVTTLGADGRLELPRNPFGTDPLQHTFGYANTVLLMRIEDGPRVFYHFQEVSDFNLACWKGHREEARYEWRAPQR